MEKCKLVVAAVLVDEVHFREDQSCRRAFLAGPICLQGKLAETRFTRIEAFGSQLGQLRSPRGSSFSYAPVSRCPFTITQHVLCVPGR